MKDEKDEKDEKDMSDVSDVSDVRVNIIHRVVWEMLFISPIFVLLRDNVLHIMPEKTNGIIPMMISVLLCVILFDMFLFRVRFHFSEEGVTFGVYFGLWKFETAVKSNFYPWSDVTSVGNRSYLPLLGGFYINIDSAHRILSIPSAFFDFREEHRLFIINHLPSDKIEKSASKKYRPYFSYLYILAFNVYLLMFVLEWVYFPIIKELWKRLVG